MTNNENMKNRDKICQNPNCNNITNSEHSRYCKKCSIRHTARINGYELDEDTEIEMPNGQVGYILRLKNSEEVTVNTER